MPPVTLTGEEAAATRAGVADRARLSLGTSHEAIYGMVRAALAARGIRGGTLVDVGCGSGSLWPVVADRFDRYVGLDAVRYDGFPVAGDFHAVDLDVRPWPVGSAFGAVVAAVETIEHLESPWAFVRALAAVAAPGGWVVVTTPNQLSALSLLTLITKRRFSAFQDSHYPAHRTALLESDLQRMFADAGLRDTAIDYSLHGRLPFSGCHYPQAVARLAPRRLSDNVMVIGQKRG
ncbi:MAG TPA: class I SAM-dependent methyltransferase [Vicinamibacterales bacterium]|nr:class I SAM-dependent methyltransferase [Vicinamibacterales bacterium]